MKFHDDEALALLRSRWESLPESLQKTNQMVGKFWVQCGYTMGPSYCSFGCSHCYLPANANRVPLVPLEEMKAQIDANRRLQGKGGHIQITGGDVVDAYVREGKEDDLVEIIAHAVKRDLIPMLMTHGQGLLDNPELLARLVQQGGLRKMSCHIDITQAGRPGFPIKELTNESQLDPMRNALVDLVLLTRKRTGKYLVAAQTVTVASKNLDSIDQIIAWLMSRPENMDVTRTLSFLTEADVGRTLMQQQQVTPERVWNRICNALALDLPRDHILYGHPDCTSVATLIARSQDRKLVNLGSQHEAGRRCWQMLMEMYGGLELIGNQPVRNRLRKILLGFRHPVLILQFLRYACSLRKNDGLTLGMMASMLTGGAKGFNIVMHNFMGAEQTLDKNDPVVQERLQACSFRGAVQQDGEWKSVSMCEMNARMRPAIYQQKIASKATKIQGNGESAEIPVLVNT